MSTKSKNFTDDLHDLRRFLADKKLLGDLAARSDAKSRTVQYALSVKSKDELKGKKLKVYLEAIAMRKEIEEIFSDFEEDEPQESP